MSMSQKEHLEKFGSYYREFFEGFKFKNRLRELENIDDIVEKYHKSFLLFDRYKTEVSYMSYHYNEGKFHSTKDDKYFKILQECQEKVSQLESIKNELAKRDEVKKHIEEKENYWNSLFSENNSQENSNKNEETYFCDQCSKEKQGKYLHHKKKNDGQKFCSTECYTKYYGEYCTKCVNELQVFKKYLTTIQDGVSNYCRSCYRIVEKEREQEEKEKNRYCKYCSTKLEESNSFKFCKSDTCLKKFDEEVSNEEEDDKENNNPTNQPREREREREQNQSLLQYFTSNSIDSIRLDNNKLFIKYTNKAEEEEEEEPKSVELQQIKDYLETIPSKSISKSELESKSKQDSSLGKENKGNNTALYWGIGIVGIVALVLGLVIVKKYKRKY